MTTKKADSLEQRILQGRMCKFSMRGSPLLLAGAVTKPLVICENLWLSSKVYCEGGENALHAHASDDHAFFVLAGRARFFDGNGDVDEIGALEGMLIPRRTLYRFQSVPPENLVIFRMAGAEADYFTLRAENGRHAPDGSLFDSKDPRNGAPAQAAKESGEVFSTLDQFNQADVVDGRWLTGEVEMTGVRSAVASAERFSVNGWPLPPESGYTMPLLRSTSLSVGATLCSERYEHPMTVHHRQDEAYFVLYGAVEFRNERGEKEQVGPLEGMMIPRGVSYEYHVASPESLVMLMISGWSTSNAA